MKKGYSIFLKIIPPLFIFIIFLVSHVFAQLQPADLSITGTPIDPKPFDTVTLTATSYGADLTQSTLTWKYNGQLVTSGVGQTSISVTAPAAGQVGTISLDATGSDFADTTASFLIHPASIDLLWEAVDSYVPPFYKGKALPSRTGEIRVTAIPSISAPNGISYNWTRNDSALPDSSGYEDSSIFFNNDSLTPTETIGVTANGGLYNGNSTVTITPGSPTVIAYQNEDGFIDYANGLTNNINSNSPGIELQFEPYFFSVPTSIDKDLAISISLDGTDITGNPTNEITLSNPSSPSQSSLDVNISTNAFSLQQLDKIFTISFN